VSDVAASTEEGAEKSASADVATLPGKGAEKSVLLGVAALPGKSAEKSASSDVAASSEIFLDAPPEVIDALKAGYEADAWFASEDNTRKLTQVGGLWWTGVPDKPRVYVPSMPALKKGLVRSIHGPPMRGHMGHHKTLKAVGLVYYWLGMSKDVPEHVRSCDSCQRNKGRAGKTPGLLQPLPVPEEPWASVSMDFITQLPKTAGGHDAILVIVDRLTKMARFVPTTTDVGIRR
jgi:hypothetical protein